MSDSFEKLKQIIDDNSDVVDLAEGATEEEISAAEAYLDVSFPGSLKKYLKQWGNIAIGPFQFYGTTGSTEFKNNRTPNGVWYTCSEREITGIPNSFFVLYDNEGDELHCMDLESEKIIVWDILHKEVTSVKADNLFDYIINQAEDFI